jgi:hypothetical protein
MRSGDMKRAYLQEGGYLVLVFYIRDLRSILNQNIYISAMIPPALVRSYSQFIFKSVN